MTFDVASGERETVRAQFVSGDTFERLGVGPAAGRLLTMQDDQRPGAYPVAVISHAFWMQRFGGDPAIVGRWFVVHGPEGDRQFQIVGVTGPRFSMEPGYSTDVWMPYAMQDPSTFGNSGYRALRVIGRLREDVTVEQVHGVLQAAFTNFRREDAAREFGADTAPDRVAHFVNAPLHVRSAATGPSPLMRARFQRPLWMLTGIAGLMLLIAGSNVANLFLARTAAREREMSLRLSLGAGRGRLIQQMLVESALVAGRRVPHRRDVRGGRGAGDREHARVGGRSVLLDLSVDWRLVAFISGMTLLSSALFGLARGDARVRASSRWPP